ncbi:MAG: transaldolase [Bacteroidales bacterium]|nr:transaldolase [Bacteroidales bacterium]
MERDRKIREFVSNGVNEELISAKEDKFWQSLRKTGTTLWLDTGDIAEAEANWTAEMSALTTNNTLLNNEIQKGIYDDFIETAKGIVADLPEEQRVKEIAFILNGRHGLRLAKRFGGLVSVELHTDTAHDIDAILSYGKRFHEICPEHFIVKVPLTSTGLLGARKLRDAGVKINFTLEFSARQNVLVTTITRPDYLNVFLGRIGAYIADNGLGDGTGAGEMAVLSSQGWVTRLSASNPWPTRLIAASLRGYHQLDLLAGTDVYTMPPKVAAAGRTNLPGNFISRLGVVYPVDMSAEGRLGGLDKFWVVDSKVVDFGQMIAAKLPDTGSQIEEMAHEAGLGNMFPVLDEAETVAIDKDGKIPVYKHWEKRLKDGTIAPDTLLTLAGIASFTADQKALDDRIGKIIF